MLSTTTAQCLNGFTATWVEGPNAAGGGWLVFRLNSFPVRLPGGPGKCLCFQVGRGGWRLGVPNVALLPKETSNAMTPYGTWYVDEMIYK